MRIKLLCFGVLKDVLQTESEIFETKGETVGDLIRLLEGRASNTCNVWTSLAVAVNRQYATRDTVLHEGDEVALLPPVSGGLEETGS